MVEPVRPYQYRDRTLWQQHTAALLDPLYVGSPVGRLPSSISLGLVCPMVFNASRRLVKRQTDVSGIRERDNGCMHERISHVCTKLMSAARSSRAVGNPVLKHDACG
jgi:hypothetical protein